MKNFVKFDFTEQDILDSFEYFMENGKHKKKEYYLDEIIDEFLQYIRDDIIEAYGNDNFFKCRNFIKNKLYNNTDYIYNKYERR